MKKQSYHFTTETGRELYLRTEDAYRHLASAVFNKSSSAVTSSERELGKRAILGCGFGMGPGQVKKDSTGYHDGREP